MPSFKQRMTTYFRQLSFIADPKDDNLLGKSSSNSECFITKFLEGRMNEFTFHSDVVHGKEPTDLPNLPLKSYNTGLNTITAACTGPDDGIAIIKRSRLHLSAGPDSDIEFIDTNQEHDDICSSSIVKNKSITAGKNQSDQNANKHYMKPRKIHITQQSSMQLDRVNSILGTTDCQSKNSKIHSLYGQDKVKTSEEKIIFIKTKDNVLPNNLDTKSLPPCINSQLNNCQRNNNENVLETNTAADGASNFIDVNATMATSINWKTDNEHVYGLSMSLYEKNHITNEAIGNPIADCYGVIVRDDCSVMALADGVNWGEGAKLAARSSIYGCLEYLDTAVFGQMPGGMATSTQEVFISLLRSFLEAHACILEVGGALSTLTVAVILPLQNENKYAVCACNVGDSLGYVYSKKHGVKEFTQGSHDITLMRDMRDALGALGPVYGDKPELSNLTLSMTVVEPGDIVFLTSDGLSDNFDPVVGKFVEPYSTEPLKVAATTTTTEIASKSADSNESKKKHHEYKRSSSANQSTSTNSNKTKSINTKSTNLQYSFKPNPLQGSSSATAVSYSRPPKLPQATNKLKAIEFNTAQRNSKRPQFNRSHTVIEPRAKSIVSRRTIIPSIPKSPAGLPLVTGPQRHTLTLLRLEDLLCYGINNTLQPCQSAKKLCHLLVDFSKIITSAKRKILEQRELFYRTTNAPGQNAIKQEIEMTKLQQRAARKRVIDSDMFSSLPGKLDHASIVAVTICPMLRPQAKPIPFEETNF